MNRKALDLGRKILALYNGATTPGEKSVAEAKLREILEKYEITIEQIEGEEQTYMDFVQYQHDHMEKAAFERNVLATVIGADRAINPGVFRDKETNETFYRYNMSYAEMVEVQAKIDFYWANFLKQFRVFKMAYNQKNHLFINQEKKGDQETEQHVLSDEEVEQIHLFMYGVSRVNFRKQLENQKTINPQEKK